MPEISLANGFLLVIAVFEEVLLSADWSKAIAYPLYLEDMEHR